MASVEKVAVSLERELLREAEKLRKRTGESRSALVSRALARLVAEETLEQSVAQYVSAYQRFPESPAEVEAARALARRSLEAVAWCDE